jgi:hypothetical protein
VDVPHAARLAAALVRLDRAARAAEGGDVNSSHSDDDLYCQICKNYVRPPRYENERAEHANAHLRQRALLDCAKAIHKYSDGNGWILPKAMHIALAAFVAAGGKLDE